MVTWQLESLPRDHLLRLLDELVIPLCLDVVYMLMTRYIIITSLVAIYFSVVISVIYDETYDEIYSVIYEVIMRKFRASMEPFYDLKISKYVE